MCFPGAPVHAEALGDRDLGLVPWSDPGDPPVVGTLTWVLALVSQGNASGVAGGMLLSRAGKILTSSWPPDTLGPMCGVKASCGTGRFLIGLPPGSPCRLAGGSPGS